MTQTWSTEQVMQVLATVPDPEIPVISLLDLGIVRDVNWEQGVCVVTITPTYSGCPAMYEMSHSIEQALQQAGIEQVRVETKLSPAWTTDWMSEQGKVALRDYGIAPPAQSAVDISGLLRQPEAPVVACPQCGSTHTRVISQFGSTPCKALYRCISCGEPFDYFKAH
ncbi:1,2-phenylacetyl-CoA epoxidase subunit PaaD [Alcaligenes aquatilis]|uniref:Phenylacetate-CoA oxygenase subunit PaaJ n=2 Tax=Alcaligenes TaxID=507 RepID=A0AB33CYJ6_ALCFA|nr:MULTISPECIES: 1,2-phenylacetyl-CoA epoxidase subunit PaaD [Alcaligenes]ASR91486.1 phenylacetate-CoA oxygenase subunit PaaJ [Alcaligenes faecalis]AWG36902.1 phenylacetate-CoA oxygenase subunit PaaJ [Alcaligenes aquatilis]MCC9162168.1 phenylacetate-CoA oxygenase subunit PaaJ [Alcaligenes sp. MMA]MCH4224168.1 phenylacetate-CoA oxygenase subunit PaaJ [Alcaligenes faecalis]UQN34803.1 phenylacetate-CoA oxygenase subunit PaaJ [Alcaligenes aquatilis]